MNERELEDAVKRLPKHIDPPRDLWPGIEARIGRRARWRRWYWVPLAAAAVLGAFIIARNVETAPSWDVTALAGRPLLGTARLTASGRLRVGGWLQTDDSSRALIAVGQIGEVEVKPDSRVQLVAARPNEHRLALARGRIDATVDAVPRLFFVETPAGTAIDLGCAYTLETDSLGTGYLHVTRGEVEFDAENGIASSRVPLGAIMQTRPAKRPGIPYVEDAPLPLVRELVAFDFEKGRARAARSILTLARAQDAISLWHLLQRVDPALRGKVFDRLAALVPPPPGVTRRGAIALRSRDLESYWTKIHSIHFRRMVLKGVKEIDPRTGTTRGRVSTP